MIFKNTVTKKEKKKATRNRLGLLLIVLGLLAVNFTLVYTAFFQKPKPIVNPMSKNQISSTKIVEDKLKESKIEYTSFDTQKDLTYILKLKSGGEVVLNPTKNIDEQLSSLQLILSQLKIEGKTLKRLDFRYEKPIITI